MENLKKIQLYDISSFVIAALLTLPLSFLIIKEGVENGFYF